mgnify:CR=1 FL=1
MSTMSFRAFVFDLDGTLIDTASELIAVYHRMSLELGNSEKPFDDARKLISHGSGRLVTEATGITEDDPRWESYRQQYLDWYEEILGTSATPYEGLVDTVAEIIKGGGAWGVVTNKFRRFAEPLMDAMPFDPPAQSNVTPCDVATAKPDPEAILLAAKQLQVSPKQMVQRPTEGELVPSHISTRYVPSPGWVGGKFFSKAPVVTASSSEGDDRFN